ncbi:hypothetical protein [Cetobacterium sp.]|uniref:hypothetical protein n=1 Tax=Cetobacterium sp. TaxID=2071632 RepID=UPI003F40E6C6
MNLIGIILLLLMVKLGYDYIFDDKSSGDEKNWIDKIEENTRDIFKEILDTQSSFSAQGSNYDLNFYKDYFQVESKSFKIDWRDIKYDDISSIEYIDPRLGNPKIVINLISNSKITIKFYSYSSKGFRPRDYYKNYFLVKLFLEKIKNRKTKDK